MSRKKRNRNRRAVLKVNKRPPNLAPQEKTNSLTYTRRSAFYGEPEKTREGFLLVDCVIAQVGVLEYEYETPDGSFKLNEFKTPEDIFSRECMASANGAPFVDDHPVDGKGNFIEVNKNNYKQLIKGVVLNPRVDGNNLIGTLKIYDPEMIEAIETKKLNEISIGFRCQVVNEPGNYLGQKYDAIHRRTTINHLALVEDGRAGSDVRVLFDSRTHKTNQNEVNKMTEEQAKAMIEMMAAMVAKMDEMSKRISGDRDPEEEEKKKEDDKHKLKEDPPGQAGDAAHKSDQPAAPGKTAEEIEKEILDSKEFRQRLNAETSQVVLLQKQAAAVLGDEYKVNADSDGIRRDVIKKIGIFEDAEVDKLNGAHLVAHYNVSWKSYQAEALKPKQNTQQDFSTESQDGEYDLEDLQLAQ